MRSLQPCGGHLKKITDHVHLSLVLLVRGGLTGGGPLHIADGYHRVCASYYVDENTDIPCRIVDAHGGSAAG